MSSPRTNQQRFNTVLATTLSCAFAAVVASQSRDSVPADVFLKGAIDLHVHELPDSETWRIDAIDVAKNARDRGMRGLVLKSHWHSTAEVAYLVRKEVPGIEVFGGIGLSRATGGVNPAAVEDMAKVTGNYGRIVWMPTLESEAGVRGGNQQNVDRPFIPVSRNGELLPEVKETIGVIGRHNLILATGHSSAAENILLAREGHRQGLKHMIVTHATSRPARMTIAQMQEAAREGAFIEIVYVHTLNIPELRRTPIFTMADVAEAVRKVGAQSIVLSTDMGQVGIELPSDGLAAFAAGLRTQGISQQDIDRMIKTNPASLLDLPVQQTSR
jgi:uncharacterized protein DUF6282